MKRNQIIGLAVLVLLLVVSAVMAYTNLAPVKTEDTGCPCGCEGKCNGNCGVEECKCASTEVCSEGCSGSCGNSCKASDCGCNTN